ncbi:adenosylcobinamide-phosphate synthase [Halalkalibacter wakoensis JCM 9140]|uniref:Cobalamin biosynthesis protein CobD n=1 Tax=Halalkalibacter wakoensis JCM 9140 TaxID=1236970 RepID=W4PY40_9BACI|nr:adenosylcobinamide-phosphate synthase CbiB [Halalkalibacter wakoensis]GAE24652.1 adenosylcobinamide-phosphate synthase [Halalkalibacter wakoensis JCM 9140]
MVFVFDTGYDPILMLCFIIVAAILLDLLIGDPKWIPHPVVQIGKLITFIESRLNKGKYIVNKGYLLTVSVISVVFLVTYLIVYVSYHFHIFVGVLVEIYIISTTIAIKGLRSAAVNVFIPLTSGDLQEARYQLSMIVGRDTKELSESEIVRGTVETVAENTVDGITAPLFWAFIGGAPLAMVYRAINTLDSMVGHKNEQFLYFGRASAKLDDVANWLPARITACSMWVASFVIKGSHKLHAWKITWRDARKHPSPNSGWSEAMVAGLLGIQLGGMNYYNGVESKRALMGETYRTLRRCDINKAIGYMHGGWIVFFMFGVSVLLGIRWM